jgi:hypothetical protein
MACPVVHDPKDALGGNVGLHAHDLFDQTTERLDPVFGLATAEEPATMDIPGGQVDQRSATLVLVLEAHYPSGSWPSGGVLAEARLDGGLLVGANDEVALTERFALKAPLIEVEHPAGLLCEAGIAGEDPAAMLPGTDGIGRKPPPDGCIRDRSDDALLDGGSGEIWCVPAGQRHTALSGQLTRQRLNRHNNLRGGKPGAARSVVAPGDRPSAAGRSVCATWKRSVGGCPDDGRSHRCAVHRQPATRSWPVLHRGTVTYSVGWSLRADRVRCRSVRSGKGWFSARLAPLFRDKHARESQRAPGPVTSP